MKNFNNWLMDKLAFFLSTIGCFYLVFSLVVIPLFFQHPTDLVGWVQYIVQSIFQGVALPVLGYVARIAGERQEQILKETHDAEMEEITELKEIINLLKNGGNPNGK